MADRARRWRAGVELVGGVVAAVVGMGSAHATPVDDIADAGAGGAAVGSAAAVLWSDTVAPVLDSAGPAGPLSTAAANIADASALITGIDASSGLGVTYASFITGYPASLETVEQFITGQVAPAESTVLAAAGPLSGLVDQLYFDPLNQQWVNTSEALFSAAQAFDSGIADDSAVDASTALFQTLGIEIFQFVPVSVESVPTLIAGVLLGDGVDVSSASDASGLF